MFQFLIGSLVTHDLYNVVNRVSIQFQFLIGSLVTNSLEELLNDFVGFQFLIGSLVTNQRKMRAIIQQVSFNSL